MKVLIVDDDPLIGEMLVTAFDLAGYSVMVAKNGDVALDRIKQSKPDIVVTDIIMPTREGIETIREIRRLFADLPIIAISGGGMLDAVSLLDVAEKFGANATLTKPFLPQQLLEKVRELTRAG